MSHRALEGTRIDEVASALNVCEGPCGIFVDMLLGVVTLQSFNDQGIPNYTDNLQRRI